MSQDETEISSSAEEQDVSASEILANQEESSNTPVPVSGLEQAGTVEFENEIDQKLYREVLEKLDIVKKDLNRDIQEPPCEGTILQEKGKHEAHQNNKFNDVRKPQEQIQIEKTLVQDFSKIQKLMQVGLINSGQGQNLKQQVLKKAFDMLVQTEKIKRSSPVEMPPKTENNSEIRISKSEVFEEFSKSNPDFFNPEGRKEVLDYLKSDDLMIGKDELKKISGIIRVVEKAAIDRYLKKAAYEKNLRASNDITKQRLTANAQKSSFGGNFSRTFNREQIGKMSSAEFAKYESVIMEQLKKGLIR